MATPGNVLAVNPGARGCGVAYFRRGLLAWAELATSPSMDRGASGWVAMAREIPALFRSVKVLEQTSTTRSTVSGYRVDYVDGSEDFALAVEGQQIYARGKGDQNDIVLLAAVAGAVAMQFQGCPEMRSYLPNEWKGDVPKPKRRRDPYIVAERCRHRLTPAELAGVKLPDDVERQWHTWDAVGIGLHHLGRWYR